jgi:TetR/AcrR family transcriptional repressor of nem operon
VRNKAFDPELAKMKALQLFWQNGYAQTSMDELLTTIGISRSSFYNAFGDKRQLYQACLQHFGQLANTATLSLQTPKPVKEKLMDFFTLSFTNMNNTAQGCLLVNTIQEQQAHDHELAQQASAFLLTVEQAIEKTIQTAIDQQEIKQDTDPKHSAAFIMTIIKGLRVQQKEGKPIEQLQPLYESALNLIV